MKLMYFSEQTLPKQMGGGKKAARVSFGKGGVITFNGPACELMTLKAGDKVTLAQDEECPTNWYFFKDPQHGFELRAAYDKKGCLFNHVRMVKELLQAFGKPEDASYNFLIGGEPTTIKGDKVKYWGVLIPS